MKLASSPPDMEEVPTLVMVSLPEDRISPEISIPAVSRRLVAEIPPTNVEVPAPETLRAAAFRKVETFRFGRVEVAAEVTVNFPDDKISPTVRPVVLI